MTTPKKPRRAVAEERSSLYYPYVEGPVYIIRKADVKALAEQITDDIAWNIPCPDRETALKQVTYALARAGFKP